MTPSSDIVVETERLLLRGWRDGDLDAFHSVVADEEHARFLGGAKTREQAWRQMAVFAGHHALRGYTMFALESKAGGSIVGWAGPWFPEGWPGREVGYSLVPSATRKGYAKEAAVGALLYAYDTLNWDSAISTIDPANEPSQRVAQSMGATPEHEVESFGETVTVWRHLPPAEFRERFA